jgi:hypothetical protein
MKRNDPGEFFSSKAAKNTFTGRKKTPFRPKERPDQKHSGMARYRGFWRQMLVG